MFWQTSRFRIDLSRPRVMGIVNLTPDSFFDGGRDAAAGIAQSERLVAEGADILDLGGESTRPGASPPELSLEMARVLPVLRHVVGLGVPISVDTSQSALMQAALDMGADIINDVRALTRPGAAAVVAAHPSAGICLMHMQGEPTTMQAAPHYGDVVGEVAMYLRNRALYLADLGVARHRIMLDPGIGFGKTDEHNWTLLRRHRELLALGYPLLAGWSRKGSLGRLTGRPLAGRLVASVAAALAAIAQGATVVRVHDVAATVDAIAVWQVAMAPTIGQ